MEGPTSGQTIHAGSVDCPKREKVAPAERRMAMSLSQYLENIESIMAKHREGRRWATVEGMVLELGQKWTGGTVEGYGPMKQCYRNALDFALDFDALYCEGWAWPKDLIPVQHAWCIVEGEVVETTWDEPAEEYIGIVMSADDAMTRTAKIGWWGSALYSLYIEQTEDVA